MNMVFGLLITKQFQLNKDLKMFYYIIPSLTLGEDKRAREPLKKEIVSFSVFKKK